MNTMAELHGRGGGQFEMNNMQRSENSSRKKSKQAKKKQNPPKSQPAMPKSNPRNSIARPQQAVAAAYASGQHTGEARVYRSGKDTCRIVHRELLQSITGSAAFAVTSTIALNPGLASSFPWLSTQAQAWERYRFNKLRFRYYTRTGTSVPGSLLMAPDFDAADAPPLSETIASSYEFCEEDAPWKDITCDLPQRSLMGDMKEKYIRSGALQPNQDIKTYDAGNLFVCTVDGTAVGWGKLWVEYDVTLFTPQVPAGGFLTWGSIQGGGNITVDTAPYGTDPVQNGPLSLTVAGDVVTIRGAQLGQEIMVTRYFKGTGITSITYSAVTGLTARPTIVNVSSATTATSIQTFIVTGVNPTLNLQDAATTITESLMVVNSLAPAPNF